MCYLQVQQDGQQVATFQEEEEAATALRRDDITCFYPVEELEAS